MSKNNDDRSKFRGNTFIGNPGGAIISEDVPIDVTDNFFAYNGFGVKLLKSGAAKTDADIEEIKGQIHEISNILQNLTKDQIAIMAKIADQSDDPKAFIEKANEYLGPVANLTTIGAPLFQLFKILFGIS